MTTHSGLTWPFADGEYTFDIGPLEQRLELEEKCQCGLLGLVKRLTEDSRVYDYRETIRLGLIGAGMKPVDALRLVQRYVDKRPVMESVPLARSILMAALVGVKDDEVGKDQAEGVKKEEGPQSTEKMDASSAPLSTDSVQPSASHQEKSTNSLSGNSQHLSMATTEQTAQRS